MRLARFAPLILAATGVFLALGACGDGDGTASAGAGEEASTGPTVSITTEGALAPYLAGPNGHTLYVLTSDPPGQSLCVDGCLVVWRPLMLSEGEPTAGPGVNGALGVIARDDGGRQVTYRGSPLYYFAGDREPGATGGQGIGDLWFVATPDGSTPLDGGTAEGATSGTADPYGY